MKPLFSTPIILMCVSATEFSFGQELPILRHVTLDVSVTHDSSNGMFYYDYALKNGSQNVGDIEQFALVIWRDPATTVAYDTLGLQFAGSKFAEGAFRRFFAAIGKWIVPVGFLKLPKPWEGEVLGNYPYAYFQNVFVPLKPGREVRGLVLMSKGLPGVRGCTIRPMFQDGLYFPNIEDDTGTRTDAQQDSIERIPIDSIRESCNYHGFTVGPWAPPSTFDPLVFLDTLTSYVRESRYEGWIKSDAGAERYLHLLALAKSGLQKSDMKTVLRTLGKVLGDVEADKSQALKPEAYALIRYNTEYLIGRLGTGKPMKR